MAHRFRIGELAARCGVTPDTIRFYEREGLLPAPTRTAGRQRIYGQTSFERVRLIRRAQELGLTLMDIRDLLSLRRLSAPERCERLSRRLKTRVEILDKKIAELHGVRDRLAAALDLCCDANPGSCPVVSDLIDAKES